MFANYSGKYSAMPPTDVRRIAAKKQTSIRFINTWMDAEKRNRDEHLHIYAFRIWTETHWMQSGRRKKEKSRAIIRHDPILVAALFSKRGKRSVSVCRPVSGVCTETGL